MTMPNPIDAVVKLEQAIFGSAQGTFSKDGSLPKENFWKTPALWQVYADNEPIRAIMRQLS